MTGMASIRDRDAAPTRQTSLTVDDLVDGQAVGASMIGLLALATLALASDGFDLSAIGYVGPELVKHWHVARAALVPMFTAGVAGLLIGAPSFGLLGDRLGRKRTLLIGLGLFGGATLLSAMAATLGEFAALRLVTGIGLGGVVPNAIAFLSEMVPARLRGRFLVIASLGVAVGVALPGLVTIALVPRFGWPVLMVIGGLLPLSVAVLLAVATPESVKFLAGRDDRADELRRAARRLRPDLALDDPAAIVRTHASTDTRPISQARLFAGRLALATPLLWLLNAANQLASFFILTWLPTLLQARGASTAEVGLGGSLFSLGGLTSGLCLVLVIDRLGTIPMLLFCFAGAPLVAGIGVEGLPAVAHGAVMFLAGLCVAGNNMA